MAEATAGTAVPLISAVVPAYNAAACLGECLQSILGQVGIQTTAGSGLFRLEVVVVDDGSADGTAGIADQMLEAAAALGVAMRVLRQPNQGPSAARNRGIAAAAGEWIAFLDSDDLWPCDRLASQMEVLAGVPGLGLVFGDCQVFSGDATVVASFFHNAGLDLGFFGARHEVLDPYVKLFTLNYIPTGAVLARRECLLQAGGFDAGQALVEDLDLWLRVARLCRIGYTLNLCQLKRRHAGGLSADLRAMTLAYIDVISRHATTHRADLRQRGVRIAPRLALEYCVLGDLSERDGRTAEARRWYWRALRVAPDLRILYYLTRTMGPYGRRAPKAHST